MHGPDFERPHPETIRVLHRASTASITTILRRQYDIKNVWCPLRPLFPGMRVVGPALTIRSVPGRDDLQAGFNKSFTDDAKSIVFNAATSGRTNPNSILNLFVNAEDQNQPVSRQ